MTLGPHHYKNPPKTMMMVVVMTMMMRITTMMEVKQVPSWMETIIVQTPSMFAVFLRGVFTRGMGTRKQERSLFPMK